MAEATPMMLQYRGLKEQHPDQVLFFRLGDFYEMFDSDAVEVSRLLNLTLTHRAGQPMRGIPYHASKVYIARLLRLGKKIAICEQVSMPQGGRTLAERKVVEIREREHLANIADIKGVQQKIEWGSQIRNYVFMPYTLVKDTRTGCETSNVNNVMDGALDPFIEAYLNCLATGNWVTK